MQIRKFSESVSENISAKYWWEFIHDFFYPLEELGFIYGVNYGERISGHLYKIPDYLTDSIPKDADDICYYIEISVSESKESDFIDVNVVDSSSTFSLYNNCEMMIDLVNKTHTFKKIMEKNNFHVFLAFADTFTSRIVVYKKGLKKDHYINSDPYKNNN